MTGAIAQLCFSSNLTGIVANKIEQSFYSVYSYSGIESIEQQGPRSSGGGGGAAGGARAPPQYF